MKRSHVYKGYENTYNVEIMNSFNPELQLKDTESAVRNLLKDLLTELRDFNLVVILVLQFKKIERDEETKYSTFYSSSKVETVINESDIDDAFESIYNTIASNILNPLENVLDRIIDSVVDHSINIPK